MDLDSDDDDFEPKAKSGTKSKRRAGDSDEDFAPTMKQKKRKKRDEVPCKTSTQGKVDSATTTGRGGRPTARLSAEEAKFQEDLQLALRVSSEEDLGGGSDDDLKHQTSRGQKKKASHAASKKETDLNDEGSIVLGDSDDEEVAVPHCPNSSSTTVILGEEEGGEANAKIGGEVEAKGDCENIVLEDSEDEKETEVAKVVEEQMPKKLPKEEQLPKKNSKPKRTTVGETWVVGERSRRSSGDQRNRKKPQKYVESSDSENNLDGVIDSDESDEEFEEEKKKKQSKTKKAPLKKPNRIQEVKNYAASRISKNPASESKQSRVPEKKVLKESLTNQPTPGSPVRPFSIHNPSSPRRPSSAATTTPTTPSLSLPALLKLKPGAVGSPLPSSTNLHRGSPAPAWKPPAKVGSSLANSSSLPPASPGLSPGLRRLGLSRNWKSPAPLHKNLKLSQ